MTSLQQSRFHSRRAGLSLLEVLGCIAAVTAGTALGAYYMGIDLHVAAYRTLSDHHVIEQLPEEIKEAIPVPPSEVQPVLSAEEIDAKLRSELDALRLEIARLARQAQSGDEALGVEPSVLDTPETSAMREQTVVYWSRLADIAAEVATLENSSEEVLNTDNVWQVLEVRRRAYQYGADAMAAVAGAGVDTQALQYGEALAQWYVGGAQLYQQAVEMWETQQLAAQGNRADLLLEKGRLQQENEASLLAEKAARLCEVLARRYAVPFSPFEI